MRPKLSQPLLWGGPQPLMLHQGQNILNHTTGTTTSIAAWRPLLLPCSWSDLPNACKNMASDLAQPISCFVLLPDPAHCLACLVPSFLCILALYLFVFRMPLIFSCCPKAQRFNTRGLLQLSEVFDPWSTALKLSSTFFLTYGLSL